jgi:hypothetical protein
VLKWDAPRQDRGKHKKFEALWIGPFKSFEIGQINTYRLQTLEGDEVFGGPVNGNFLKKFFRLYSPTSKALKLQKSSWHLTGTKPFPMEPNVITFICKRGVFSLRS